MRELQINVQNLAYCRYLHIWSLLYFLNMIKSTPLSSLIIVSFFHLFNIGISSKKIGILLQDYLLIYTILCFDRNLYIYDNLFTIIIYTNVLLIININPIKLYTKLLPADDKQYANENYYEHLLRIWKLFFLNL